MFVVVVVVTVDVVIGIVFNVAMVSFMVESSSSEFEIREDTGDGGGEIIEVETRVNERGEGDTMYEDRGDISKEVVVETVVDGLAAIIFIVVDCGGDTRVVGYTLLSCGVVDAVLLKLGIEV